MTRQLSSHKPQFILYSFAKGDEAQAALLEVTCIHLASDTNEMICTVPIEYGFYSCSWGGFEAILAGDALTLTIWQEAKTAFERHGGTCKNSLLPDENSARAKPPLGGVDQVKFVRTDNGEMLGRIATYRIHDGPSEAAALAFLQANPVTQQYLYLVVQTPDGNWARDINGIYKETC
jgi:hypothetical protein